MPSVSDAFRSRLNDTFTNGATERPAWIDELEQGSDAGFFGPGSATWAVHGGNHTVLAGVRALLVQALHPGALAGVADHSRYREDPFGRLAGTIRWIYTVSHGDTEQATHASQWVRKLHERVVGEYVDGHGRTPRTTRTWPAGCTSRSPTRSSAARRSGERRSPAEPTPTSASGRSPDASWASTTRPSPSPSSARR